MTINPYDIVLVKSDNSFFAKLITFFSKDQYVHCFIVNKDGKAVDIDPRNRPNNLKLKDISSWDKELLEVYEIDKESLTEEVKYKIDEFIFTHKKSKYDFFDCILMCLHLPPDRDQHFSCQSLLANCLRYSRLSCHAITISDFKRLNYLHKKEEL